jgi:CHAT domain-containing protein
LLVPLRDTLPGRAQAAYDCALANYHRGQLAKSQREAEWGFQEFRRSSPPWAARFKQLQAEVLLWRGMEADTLHILAAYPADPDNPEQTVHVLAMEAIAHIRRRQLPEADDRLNRAEQLCHRAELPSCGDVLKARGSFAGANDDFVSARQQFLKAYSFALAHGNLNLQATAALNASWASIIMSHYDEALDWARISYRDAVALGDEDLALGASGNLGMAYFPFGDAEESRKLFLDAANSAARLGDMRNQLVWLDSLGESDAYSRKYPQAIEAYRQALKLARQIDDKDRIDTLLLDLADALTETGNFDEAASALDQAAALPSRNQAFQKLALALFRANLDAGHHQDEQAERLFRGILADPDDSTADSTAIKSRASSGLAQIFVRHGRLHDAELTYKSALTSFEAARAKNKGIASQLPLMTIGMPLYAGYIQLLVQQGRSEEALAIANQSRAQTLAHRLETSIRVHPGPAEDPRTIARKTGATLLFYWLAEKQSYLWAITPQKVVLFKLPPQEEIERHVLNYRQALLEIQDPIHAGNPDGSALYAALVAPVAGLLRRNAPVILLDDGSLSKLNFETLPAPGASPGLPPSSGSHYWIEDVALRSAPSLSVLAAQQPDTRAKGGLLLMGAAVSPSPDYPELPMAPSEMALIQKHFSATEQTVLARGRATPAAYLDSLPARYSYIHFVTHGVASSTDPLDSSIILSRPGGEDSSFKLYARDILQHPINARLVTISACYGSGSRAYSGEGLVGLSWAFLGAGARNVIGALWEVSDESTPRLMDSLYQGIQQGQEPSVALRKAKLALLQGTHSFRAPFFWAPFQLYTVR